MMSCIQNLVLVRPQQGDSALHEWYNRGALLPRRDNCWLKCSLQGSDASSGKGDRHPPGFEGPEETY